MKILLVLLLFLSGCVRIEDFDVHHYQWNLMEKLCQGHGGVLVVNNQMCLGMATSGTCQDGKAIPCQEAKYD